MGLRLKLSADPRNPWNYFEPNNNTCIGIQCNLIQYLSKSLNFTYDLVYEPRGVGHAFPNRSWDGMIGRIIRNVCLILLFDFNLMLIIPIIEIC